jgi:hypothetical protein
MLRYSLRQRFRYRFDNALSRSVWVVLLWLGGLAVTFLLTIALVIWLTKTGPGDEPTSFMQGIWYAGGIHLSGVALGSDVAAPEGWRGLSEVGGGVSVLVRN